MRRAGQAFLRSGGLLFVAVTLLALLVGWKLLTGGEAGFALPVALQDLTTLALSIVVEALPFIVLGAVVSAAIRVYVPVGRVFDLLPRSPALRRFVLSFLGVFMPVCECGNVPVARGLMARGVSVSESTTFLLAAPIINPVTLLATSQAFRLDPSIVWLRMLGALFVANLVGALVALHRDQTSLLSKSFYAATYASEGDHAHHGHHHHHHESSRWREALGAFREETSLMLAVLCVGAIIAGLTQVFVPRDVLTALGAHPVLSILAMIALAFVVSICANVDAFFALAYSTTFTAGSIVAFLVFGPMVDIKMLAMMRTTYRTGLLVVVTAVVALCSVLIGLVVNYAL